MQKAIIFIFFLFGYTLLSHAQLQVQYNGMDIKASISQMSYTLVPSVDVTEYNINSLDASNWVMIKGTNLKLNRLSQTLILRIPLNQVLSHGNFDFVTIDNPHINFL